MEQHYHASFDATLVAVSFIIAVLGSFAALLASRKMMTTTGSARWKWLVGAAGSLGGGGIWSMHFVGMAAYKIDSPVFYSVIPTLVSAVAAMIVPAIGLHIVSSRPDRSILRLVLGGVFTGAGVAVMHYLGMSAMQTQGHLSYNNALVLASIVIAVVAATVALFLAISLKGTGLMAGAAAIMGVAVCGMHYTGMAAASFRIDKAVQLNSTTNPMVLAFIVTIFAVLVLAPVIYVLMTDTSSMLQQKSMVRFRSAEAQPTFAASTDDTRS